MDHCNDGCFSLVVSFFFTILIFKGTGLDYIITPYNFSFIISLFCVNVFFSDSERIRGLSGTPLILMQSFVLSNVCFSAVSFFFVYELFHGEKAF
jgi:hypothetical protein